jgi:hypothetical protein
MSEVKQYAERDAMALDDAGGYYLRHVLAMTGEKLHSKSDIAAELGWRDMQIEQLKAERDAMAAEVVTSIQAVDYVLECYEAAQVEGLFSVIDSCGDENIKDIFQRRIIPIVPCLEPTPATDAFLNSVRADGIELLAVNLATPNHELADGTNRINKAVAWYARQFANQLRAGKDK